MERVANFIFLGFKIAVEGDWSHKIKRHPAPWKNIYDKPNSKLKNRDITLPTKDSIVKAMVFPVVMYGCESWTIKKTECQLTDSFELWC